MRLGRDATDRELADVTVSALQALFETCNVLAAELPATRREKVEKLLPHVQQARATVMAEMMCRAAPPERPP